MSESSWFDASVWLLNSFSSTGGNSMKGNSSGDKDIDGPFKPASSSGTDSALPSNGEPDFELNTDFLGHTQVNRRVEIGGDSNYSNQSSRVSDSLVWSKVHMDLRNANLMLTCGAPQVGGNTDTSNSEALSDVSARRLSSSNSSDDDDTTFFNSLLIDSLSVTKMKEDAMGIRDSINSNTNGNTHSNTITNTDANGVRTSLVTSTTVEYVEESSEVDDLDDDSGQEEPADATAEGLHLKLHSLPNPFPPNNLPSNLPYSPPPRKRYSLYFREVGYLGTILEFLCWVLFVVFANRNLLLFPSLFSFLQSAVTALICIWFCYFFVVLEGGSLSSPGFLRQMGISSSSWSTGDGNGKNGNGIYDLNSASSGADLVESTTTDSDESLVTSDSSENDGSASVFNKYFVFSAQDLGYGSTNDYSRYTAADLSPSQRSLLKASPFGRVLSSLGSLFLETDVTMENWREYYYEDDDVIANSTAQAAGSSEGTANATATPVLAVADVLVGRMDISQVSMHRLADDNVARAAHQEACNGTNVDSSAERRSLSQRESESSAQQLTSSSYTTSSSTNLRQDPAGIGETFLIILSVLLSVQPQMFLCCVLVVCVLCAHAYTREMRDRRIFLKWDWLTLLGRNTDRLLADMMPQQILTDVWSGRLKVAYEYHNMTLLFADIVGFTK